MKTNLLKLSATLLPLGSSMLIMTGCCSKTKPEPRHERGWIGGEYKAVCKVPAELKNQKKTCVLLTDLATNTPAYAAGLRPGDLILEVNHQRPTGLRSFRDSVDRSQPGSVLPIQVWHETQKMEYDVRVGRETYTANGTFMIGLPPFLHPLQLWPSSGFSVGVVGYELESGSERKELQSAETTYLKNCDPKNFKQIGRASCRERV